MQAMTGLPQFSIRSKMRWPRAASCCPSTAESRSQLLNVGAGGKSLFARSGEQNGADTIAGREFGERSFEFVEGRLVKRVQHLGAIERKDRQRLADFKENVFEAHDCTGLVAQKQPSSLSPAIWR